MYLKFTTILTFLALSSCGQEHKDSYSFEYNGCKTGNHEYTGSSQEEARNKVCAALKDDKTNNYCAQEMRAKEFESKCPGQKWDSILN